MPSGPLPPDRRVCSRTAALARWTSCCVLAFSLWHGTGIAAPPTALDGDWVPGLYAQGTTPTPLEIFPDGDRVFTVGNSFSAGDARIDGVAVWNAATGKWAAVPGEFTGGSAEHVAVLGDDLYVAGTFTSVDGVPAQHIARWNGAAWSALGAGVTGKIARLEVMEGALFAFGPLGQAGGITVKAVARFDGTSWSRPDYDNGFFSVITALEVGEDTWVSSNTVTHVGPGGFETLPWDTEGSLVQTPKRFAHFHGELYAGGDFQGLEPEGASYIARWDGTQWRTVGVGLAEAVSSLRATEDGLYAVSGGDLHRWDGTSWTLLGEPSLEHGDDGQIASVAVEGERVFVAGAFHWIGDDPFPGSAVWDETAGQWQGIEDTSGRGLDGPVLAASAGAAGVFVAGQFTTNGDESVVGIARWNGDGWSPVGTRLAWSQSRLAVGGHKLYAIGAFHRPGLSDVYRLGRWNGGEWETIGPPPDGDTSALVASGGRIYAAGHFDTGTGYSSVAIWNGIAWSYLPGSANGSVYAIEVESPGVVLLAGAFKKVGEVAATNIARWNGTAWTPLGPGLDDTIHDLVIREGIVYAGGDFLEAGELSVPGLARWDGAAWSAVGDLGGATDALASDADALYATRRLPDGTHVLRWKDDVWESLGLVDGSSSSLAVHGGRVFAGGYLFGVDSTVSSYAALWSPCDLALQSCVATTSTTTTTLDTTTTTSLSTTTTLAPTTTQPPPTTTSTSTSTTTSTASSTTESSSTTSSTTTSTSTSTTIEETPLCGDADGNRLVTASDALYALKAAVGALDCDVSLCDASGDGAVTAADALAILRSAVGLPIDLLCPR